MKKIDYVIISSDDNPMYKDFYPIVAKRWNELGIKTYYINITDKDCLYKDEYGIVHCIKSIENLDTGFQSQVVRLFSSKFLSGNILMSDIDMFPIYGDYFNGYNDELTDDNVIIFSGQPYGNVPYYPMCYVLSHSRNFVKYLGIENLNFEQYCNMLLEKYGKAWNTDEHFMYDQFQFHLDKILTKNRDLSRRIDRGNWTYNLNHLKDNYYIDSHMLRPYSTYKRDIDFMVENIKKIKA